MNEVFLRLTAWLAPILVFTTEEVWLSRFPGAQSSVHLRDFPETPEWRDDALAAKWSGIRKVRRVVTGALEIERREKRIGASLEAAPLVVVSLPENKNAVDSTDFADMCITSGIDVVVGEVGPVDSGLEYEQDGSFFQLEDLPGIWVRPDIAPGAKCQRCWKILPEVGEQSDPNLCVRCNDIVHP